MSRTRNFSQTTKATERKKVEQMSKEEVQSELQMLSECKRTREGIAKHLIGQVRAELTKSIFSLQQAASKKIEAIITESNIKTAQEIEVYERLKMREEELRRRQMEEQESFNRARESQKAKNMAAQLLGQHAIHLQENIFQIQADRKYDPSLYSHRKKKEARSLTSRKN